MIRSWIKSSKVKVMQCKASFLSLVAIILIIMTFSECITCLSDMRHCVCIIMLYN